MTDAHYPERWLNDRRIQRLTPLSFKAFVVSLAWSVGNRTDGVIEPGDLPLIIGFTPDCIDELVASDLWSEGDGCWLITVFEETQTSKAQLEAQQHAAAAKREKGRIRTANFRAKQKESDVTHYVTHQNGVTLRTCTPGQDRPGQAGGLASPGLVSAREECPDCDENGWVVDNSNSASRCKHPSLP